MRKKGLVLCLVSLLVSFVVVSGSWAEVVEGEIAQIDLGGNTLSVKTAQGETLSLTFDPVDFIVWKGDDEVEAKIIQVGNKAEVGYYADENGAKIASWVDLTPLEATTEEMVESPETTTEGMTGDVLGEGTAPADQPAMAGEGTAAAQ